MSPRVPAAEPLLLLYQQSLVMCWTAKQATAQYVRPLYTVSYGSNGCVAYTLPTQWKLATLALSSWPRLTCSCSWPFISHLVPQCPVPIVQLPASPLECCQPR